MGGVTAKSLFHLASWPWVCAPNLSVLPGDCRGAAGLGFRVQGLGFRIWGFEFRGLGSKNELIRVLKGRGSGL